MMAVVIENEVRIMTDTGVVIAVPEFPTECSYVRLLDSSGTELGYWDYAEWRDEPEEAMGAIFGCVCSGVDT